MPRSSTIAITTAHMELRPERMPSDHVQPAVEVIHLDHLRRTLPEDTQTHRPQAESEASRRSIVTAYDAAIPTFRTGQRQVPVRRRL
jgi:hypothetical protein